MYSGSGFTNSELGDVDVLYVEGVFHLFHLVLPNHDYIAHAVSEDGFVWRRVQNALFIGNPGEWDDDMLWTMHVTPDPYNEGKWRMFYTGLSRHENGRVQRVGLARSDDLYTWTKDHSGNYPLSVPGTYYESHTSEGRNWVSFRDPFFFQEDDNHFLLANARVNHGPVVRRGCVSLAKETEPDKFEFQEPLFFPRMYDDVEVPVLFKLGSNYYLTGSLREDRKVHYWLSKSLMGPYTARYDNVLLPQGNYAARITRIEDRYLLWNFFVTADDCGTKILPPPKEIEVQDDGRLLLSSYSRFSDRVDKAVNVNNLMPLDPVLHNPSAETDFDSDGLRISCNSGYEIFHLNHNCIDFRLKCSLIMEGTGKAGFSLRSDHDGNGFFISLDMINGFAQARAWGIKGKGEFEDAFIYHGLQEHHFTPNKERRYEVELIAYGAYLELSIDGYIVLSLVDTSYTEKEKLGFYVESAKLLINNLSLETLSGPTHEDYGPI